MLLGLAVLGLIAWGHPIRVEAAGGPDNPTATVNQFRGALQDGNLSPVPALLMGRAYSPSDTCCSPAF